MPEPPATYTEGLYPWPGWRQQRSHSPKRPPPPTKGRSAASCHRGGGLKATTPSRAHFVHDSLQSGSSPLYPSSVENNNRALPVCLGFVKEQHAEIRNRWMRHYRYVFWHFIFCSQIGRAPHCAFADCSPSS